MRAGELCVRDVVTAEPDETVSEAARRMAQHHAGDLVVVEPASETPACPIGIVTDRDLVVRVLAHPDRDPARTRVAEVMHPDPVIAREEDDLETVLARMRAHTIRRIPVVDDRGRLQGILSIDDLIDWVTEQMLSLTKLLDRQGRPPHLRGSALLG